MSSYMYFDKDGIVVESPSSQLDGGSMGYRAGLWQTALHRPFLWMIRRFFERYLNLTQQLSSYKIAVDGYSMMPADRLPCSSARWRLPPGQQYGY